MAIFPLSTVIVWGNLSRAFDELLDVERAAGSAVSEGLVACPVFVSHSGGGGLSLGEEHSEVMSMPSGRQFEVCKPEKVTGNSASFGTLIAQQK